MKGLLRSLWCAAALAVGTLGVSPTAAQSDGVFDRTVASTVRVLAQHANGNWDYGTGWVIQGTDKEKRAGAAVIVTARHVIVGAVKIVVVESGKPLSEHKDASVFSTSVDRDIAFLEVKDISAPALRITAQQPPVGDDIAAAGYTTASDKNENDGSARIASIKRGGLSKVFQGRVNEQAQAAIYRIEYDAPVLSGFSGGPVLDKGGCVIGLTISDGGHVQVAPGASIGTAQGVATAVASNEIIAAASEAGVVPDVTRNSCAMAIASPTPTPTPIAKPTCDTANSDINSQGQPCIRPPHVDTPFVKFVKSPAGIAVAVAIVALIGIIIFAIAMILRGRKRAAGSGSYEVPEPVGTGGSTLGSTIGDTHSSGPQGGSGTLRLTGRGPNGEPINLRFASGQLGSGAVVLGRDAAPQGLVPDTRPDPFVSSEHARIGFDGRNFTVVDAKSTNGTFIGADKLKPGQRRVLVAGDTLKLADVALNVSID